jgi:hypothetical protein
MNAIFVSSVSNALAASANDIFLRYDDAVIVRRKKVIPNIDSRYICQFTIQQLSRTHGGLRASADALAESFETNAPRAYAASSITEARKKFPAEIFLDINQALVGSFSGNGRLPQFGNRRVMVADASKVVLPRALLRQGFQLENKKSHYPTGLVSTLYEVGTQFIHDISLNAHLDERKAAVKHFDHLSPGDIVVYDRGYFSYKLLLQHRRHGSDLVIRYHEALSIREITELIKKFENTASADEIVTIGPKSPHLIKKLAAEFTGEELKFQVRFIKYTYGETSYYLLTTLTDRKRFPASVFPDLYHSRWGIEEIYKQVKVFILNKEFHGKCPKTIRQELYAAALLANFSRVLTMAAEAQRNEGTKKKKNNKPTRKMAIKQILRCLSQHPSDRSAF